MSACGACVLERTLDTDRPDYKCGHITPSPFEGVRMDETGGILLKVQYPNNGPCIHIRLWEIPRLSEFFRLCNKLFGAPLILPPTLHLPAQQVHSNAA